jgi:hypothetical protein
VDKRSDESAELVSRLADSERMSARVRVRLLGQLAHRLTEAASIAARTGGVAAAAGGRWLGDVVIDIAPRVPVRDLPTLRKQFHGLEGDALADALTAAAVRNVGLVGAAAGTLSAVQFAAPPLLLTAPAQIAAETLVVVAIELKLIAELHEVHGCAPSGTLGQRSTALLRSWAHRRGVKAFDVVLTGRLPASLGVAARRDVRRRVQGRIASSTTSVGPFLIGAALGAAVNRRQTSRLARAIRKDLQLASGVG